MPRDAVGQPVAAVMRRAALALLLMGGIAAAEDEPRPLGDLSIEELMELRVEKVTTASKYEQAVTRAPASVTVVTAEEIRKSGYRTLADILGSIRGLYVSNDRNYAYLGVRGFLRPGDYNSRVLLLVDGHRLNENVYDGAYIGRESMVNVDLIERVEFIRGPGSSIYGSNAMFGVINVITRRGRDFGGGEIALEAGSFDSYFEELNYGQRLDSGVELALSASNYSSDGHRRLYYREFDPAVSGDPRAANGGDAEAADAEDAQSLYATASYGDWTLSLFGSSREKDVPTASFSAVFNDDRLHTVDRRVYADLKLDRALAPDLRLLARLGYDRYTFLGDYPLDYAAPGDPPDVVVNTDEALGEWATAEVQLTQRLGSRHVLLAGAEYRENFNQDQINYDAPAPGTLLLDQPHDSRILGVFAQGEFSLAGWLNASVGLRYDDYFGDFGSALNPRLGLIVTPRPSTTLKALYASAYRVPNVYESFYWPAQAARPALEPETIRSFELAADQYVGRSYRVGLSAYRYEFLDLITQTTDADGAIVYDNLDDTRVLGLELEAQGWYGSGFEVLASVAVQKSEDVSTRQELSASPRQLGRCRLIAPLAPDGVFGTIEWWYVGSMRTLGGSRVGPARVGNFTLRAGTSSRAWTFPRASTTCSTSPTRIPARRTTCRTRSRRTGAASR
jgi:outer membrane receptor for ferrienterochelin and colicins